MPGASAKPVISSVFHKRFRLPTRITTQNDKFVKSLGRGTMLVCDGSAGGKAVVNNCFDGYNACVFAYGQTGSGKTHTMLGDIGDGGVITPASGLIPRIFDDLLTQMASRSAAAALATDDDDDTMEAGCGMDGPGTLSYDCHVSMLEIYNESITDLLAPENTNLQVREDAVQGIHVENLSKFKVHALADVLGLLEQGTKNRHIGETRMNRESSRSHCVLVATLRADRRRGGVHNTLTSRLNLVDLAGSEQQKASGAVGERLREASNINKSLSILGRVINSLAQQTRARGALHVPYRDSKLTFLLQDSLGGNSKTVMIANVSPSTANITETQGTLRFAQRAKRMGNRATVNENTAGDPDAMRREIMRLKRELAEARTVGGGGMWPGTPQQGMCTPMMVPGAGAAPVGTPGAASPHNIAVVELVHAVERAQQAENLLATYKEMNDALQTQCSAYEQEKLKRKMMERFREGEVTRLQQIVSSGKVTGAEQLVSDTVEKLRAKVVLCEAQRDGHKVYGVQAEIHTANARVQELRTRLLDARNRRDPDRKALLEQVHNLQNLLLVLKAPDAAGRGAGSEDGLEGGSLLGGLDVPPLDTAMCRGAEMLCHQKTRDAELVEAEKARQAEALQGVHDAHAREISSLRAELDQERTRERERQDDSSRVHEELLAVRGELAQARADNERAYHEQLLPTQRELSQAKAETAELAGRVAELEEQVADLTAALTREAEAKVNTQEELSRVGEALEVSMASAEDLRRQCEEQALALDEHEDRADWLLQVQSEMREVNLRNKELETRNASLEWDATRAEELRQSQVMEGGAGQAGARGGDGGEPPASEAQQQAEHVVDVLRTEVKALTIELEQTQADAERRQDRVQKELDGVQASLRAAEIERDDMHVQYLEAMKQMEALLEDKLQLKTTLGSAESMLHSERQSVSDMRAALKRARGPEADAADAEREVHLLRDALESVTAERDQLTHEVAMVRETVRHNRLASAEAARTSRASDVAPDSFAGQFHAHAERIRELQTELEVLENERSQAVNDLEEERERHAKQAMDLRKEVMAVQQSLADDKERTVANLTTEFERQLGVREAKLKEVRAAVRHANRAAAQHGDMVGQLQRQLAAGPDEASANAQVKEAQAEQERCLRDYAQLAGAVLQLAAWTCGAGGDGSGALAALRASAASDENRDSHNRAPVGSCGGLMSPRSAALALQRGPAGEALGQAEQWTKVSAMLRRSGKPASLGELSEGHSQLKTTVSDLLIWLNASNVGV